MPEVLESDRVLDCRSTQFSIRNQIAMENMRQNFVAGSLGSGCIAKKRNVTGFIEVQHRRKNSRVCGEN
jgi:glucose-6-phosphate 1-dehydrogenase